MNHSFSLLDEALFQVRVGAKTYDWTLPDILASLSGHGEALDAFCNLQIHQHQSWFCFLVQLGALALGDDVEPIRAQPASFWRERLLGLTQGQREPWCLVVPDEQKPAFMQPPSPPGAGVVDLSKDWASNPESLDILITAKNFDLKSSRLAHPAPEHWVFALINLQTLQGFLGVGNYGVARMNGGFASRAMVGLVGEQGWRARWGRDVQMALQARDKACVEFEYRPRGGHALLWTLPWDGASALDLRSLDPLYIEICRRVRLAAHPSRPTRLASWARPSACQRIHAKERGGDVGDLWAPVRRADQTSLTVSGHGFHYELVQSLLVSQDYKPSYAQAQQDSDRAFWALVLARGQGETAGLHFRAVHLPLKVREMLRKNPDQLRARSSAQVQDADVCRANLLRPALRSLYQAGSPTPNPKDDRPQAWLARLDAFVDGAFFDALWAGIEQGPVEARFAWKRLLWEQAQALLAEASESVPLPSIRRYKAQATAESLLLACARKHFADLFVDRGGDHAEPNARTA